MNFARALIEIDVSKPPTMEFEVKLPRGHSYIQKVEYENYPHYCFHCQCFGHNHLKCPKLVPSPTHGVSKEGPKEGGKEQPKATKPMTKTSATLGTQASTKVIPKAMEKTNGKGVIRSDPSSSKVVRPMEPTFNTSNPFEVLKTEAMGSDLLEQPMEEVKPNDTSFPTPKEGDTTMGGPTNVDNHPKEGWSLVESKFKRAKNQRRTPTRNQQRIERRGGPYASSLVPS